MSAVDKVEPVGREHWTDGASDGKCSPSLQQMTA